MNFQQLLILMGFLLLCSSGGVLYANDCVGESGAAFGLCAAYCEAMDCDSDDPKADDKACETVLDNYQRITGNDYLPCECPCFADSQWSRIWDEWPADGASVQCAEFPLTYSFELGHWVFGDDKAREFIAVLDIVSSGYTACRAQYGDDPSSSHDVPITAEKVEFCAEIMRAKADAEGVTCD